MAGDSGWIPANLDPARPSSARIYDYALGGGHNLASDRALFEQVLKVQPNARQIVWSNRSFMRRAVLFMMDLGIRQFLDLGSGIPTVGNVHEIAHKVDPACRVVYVDIDEVAIAHSKLMLEHEDNAAIVEADFTRPGEVLGHPETVRLLDFTRPIGLLAVASLHSVPTETDIYRPLERYRDALAVGSALAVSHFTADFEDVHTQELIEIVRAGAHNQVCARTRDEVLDLFGDFELADPGLVTAAAWRPDTAPAPDGGAAERGLWAGVAVKVRR
ncbi:O-Methyltransferase involved in polyketide biosynthesis [Kibdelosporangium sp. 4NS15]|uniref:O-Methyltransferase involved in polyketide biosynthesis n=1 Tax=Kibdelosporangium persicum TaxID=2698649 RepID=A0ABX2FHG5_9PSEU|nr:SAM-dependent methyltransferase [Kibdelosporangium persicum]NRN70246.1 O-Methyltransferase involved in polyketide biosynthesis [Kibdelosporangium persicum]